MRAFANDFMRTLFENLVSDSNELKVFLLYLLEKSDTHFVHNPAKDWGELNRATPWAKRIQLLHRV